MSDYKDLTVQLQPLDAKVLIPGTKTRRARRAKMEGGSNLDKATDIPTVPMPAPIPAHVPTVAPVPEPISASSSMTPADIPLPSTPAAAPIVGGGTVKIKDKRNAPPPVGAKILPKKRSPTTFKKPKLVVSSPAPETKIQKDGGAKTRRFSERSISIEMKPISATRRHRKDLGKKIASMSEPAIRKFLLRKGVLKTKASTALPEAMLRSMLKDYLLLHTVE